MDDGFQIGMKVRLNNEYGVVVQGKGTSEWDLEPGIIRWDTMREADIEDWRGMYGSFLDSGGEIIDGSYEFHYITDTGQLRS